MIFQALRCALTSQIRNELTKDSLNRFAKYRICASFRFAHQQEQKSSVLVYEAPLKGRIRFTKLLSLTSSLLGLPLLPYALAEIAIYSVPMAVGTGVMCSALMSTPLLLHWVTRRYVLSLQFNPSNKIFSATTFDLVTRETKIDFSANEVHVPDLPAFLSSFEVRGRPLFVDARTVKDPDAYSHMMGYDKPLEMHINNNKHS